MSVRQPVVIMRRTHRVHVEASVFPLFKSKRDAFPRNGAAMRHGTVEECEWWCSQHAEHVDLLGVTVEVRDYDWQGMIYAKLAMGHTLPESCTWRPPEEIEQQIREAVDAEAAARVQALAALVRMRDTASEMIAAIMGDGAVDRAVMSRIIRDVESAVDRHQFARDRLQRAQGEPNP